MIGDWSLDYDSYDPDQEGRREALCTLGNGVICTRGAAPDAGTANGRYPGTYLAGGYNRIAAEVEGQTIENECLVNWPNWLVLKVALDGAAWLDPDQAELLDYRQSLDFQRGLLIRDLRLKDDKGRVVRWQERRMVSMDDPHLAGIAVTLTPEGWSGDLTVCGAIDGTVINDGVPRYRAVDGRHLETTLVDRTDEDIVVLRARTLQSRVEMAMAQRLRLVAAEAGDGAPIHQRKSRLDADIADQTLTVSVSDGQAITVEKMVGFQTSRDAAVAEPAHDAACHARLAPGFDAAAKAHGAVWDRLWQTYAIDLQTDAEGEIVGALRLYLFHILQTGSRFTALHDAGIPPRGWHGEAYRGHIMWDELFVLQFLNHRHPALSRAFIGYRYKRLAEARRAAKREGCRGAMFPWQSGSTGREESQRLHLNPMSGNWIADNSHRQRHINCAIAYNIWRYYEITEDREFLCDIGTELLVEIARFFADLASHDPADDRYHIRGVMGPDEFHTAYPGRDPSTEGGLDDNAYTNAMVAWLMVRTIEALQLMPDQDRRSLQDALGVDEDELTRWEEISRRLAICFHDGGIISQFAGYGDLEEFDWDGYRQKYGDIQRLDRILEQEGDDPNRYKASKQADVLMLFYLFSAEELGFVFERLGYPLAHDTIPRTVDYYMQRTSHGSTLSFIVHSWVMARVDRSRSWSLFSNALRADIDDIQGGTTREGIHLGAMAGVVDIVQRCFTGLEARNGTLHLNPLLPAELDRLGTTLHYRGHTLDLEIDQQRLVVTSRHSLAQAIRVAYRGQTRILSPSTTVRFHLIERPDGGADAMA